MPNIIMGAFTTQPRFSFVINESFYVLQNGVLIICMSPEAHHFLYIGECSKGTEKQRNTLGIDRSDSFVEHLIYWILNE